MDLIEEFVRRTDNGLAPERYRRWAALVMVAAVLDRRVYTAIRSGKVLFPNLYVMLVGPSGRGKTMAIEAARDLLETQAHVGLAPDYASYQSFIKRLGERAQMVDAEESMPRRRATMALMLSEWGSFMNKPDNAHLAVMAHVFDCKDFKADVLCRDLDNAENLYINICAGVVPDWFAVGLPANSFKQGFPARLILVYEQFKGDTDDTPSFECEINDDPEVRKRAFIMSLLPALEKLAAVRGFMTWTAEALAELNHWKSEGYVPVPTDTMLEGYTTRRFLFVSKLAMLCAVSSHPGDMTIKLPDFKRAKALLLDVEPAMPKALSAAGGNIYQSRMEAVATFVERRYIQTKRYVPEWEVHQKLGNLVPPNLLPGIIDSMVTR